MNTKAITAAKRFHELAEVAARHGGFWVSAGGGTANVIAGQIAQATGETFDQCLQALECASEYGPDWYAWLGQIQPFDGDPDSYRFDARTIARAACRNSIH